MDQNRSRSPRRTLLGALSAAAAGLAMPGIARAQAWPTRPITLIVGFPPGGLTDIAARLVQTGMSRALGQTVVIENRGGAGGNIGTEAAMRARPDGYTLLAANSSAMAINPHTFPGMTVNPLEAISMGLILKSPQVLAVHPSVAAQDLSSFVAWLKAQPASVSYGTPATGSMSHLAMELLRSRVAAPPMVDIPYRGSGPAVQDFIAGRFPTMIDATSVLAPFLKAGQIRGIMMSGDARIPAFPDLPTAAEAGLPDFVVEAWIGLSGPRGTPAEVVQTINAALNAALSEPSLRDRIVAGGDAPGGGTAAEFDAMVRRDRARWGEVARTAKIQAA